jgi:hypothetical protein
MWWTMILLGTMAPVSAPAPVQRLSDAQIAQVLDEAAAKREASEAAAIQPKREIRGEVGVEVGTGGYRGVYGSAFFPFGDEGGVMLSGSTQDYGNR